MISRIEVPAAYLRAVVGPNPTVPRYRAPAGPSLFLYLRAGYGSVVEGPPFVLRGNRPMWLGPRPISVPFVVTVP